MATVFLALATRASTCDQAALGTHMAKSRVTDELCLDRDCRDRLPTVFLLRQRFFVATDFSRPSAATENPETWDFPMSRHRAYVATVHNRGAHTIEIFDPVSQQEIQCRDRV